jgi:hypothetical protein
MQDIRFHLGWEFERAVAAVYRTLGAQVDHNIALAGNQIDLLVRERTPSGGVLRIAVECKAYSRPVGVDVVNSFGTVAYLLKQRQLIDRAYLVAKTGFTLQARNSATAHDIGLVDFAELMQRVAKEGRLVSQAECLLDQEYRATAHEPNKAKRLFVVMPFSVEFDDIYILGIREVAERMGLIAERADNIEHNEDILKTIQDRIQTCSAVVADASTANPNVFYEIGYADGTGRPIILICRANDRDAVPFDIRSKNLILYSSIVDLRARLDRRLRETLNLA